MPSRSEEHTSELQSQSNLVCRLLLEKKKHTSELQSQSNLVCRLLLEKKKNIPSFVETPQVNLPDNPEVHNEAQNELISISADCCTRPSICRQVHLSHF